jgi:hypothetical protein
MKLFEFYAEFVITFWLINLLFVHNKL